MRNKASINNFDTYSQKKVHAIRETLLTLYREANSMYFLTSKMLKKSTSSVANKIAFLMIAFAASNNKDYHLIAVGVFKGFSPAITKDVRDRIIRALGTNHNVSPWTKFHFSSIHRCVKYLPLERNKRKCSRIMH